VIGEPAEALLERARGWSGPILVVGRPRSGTRAVARLLLEAGVFLGAAVSPDHLDSLAIYQRFVVPLLASRQFPRWPELGADPGFDAFCHERLADALAHHLGGAESRGSWGWKYPETLFAMPLLARLLPGARFVHLIRDGRDVCLSEGGFWQLTGSHHDPPGWDPPPLPPALRRDGGPAVPDYHAFCLAVALGDASARRFGAIDLDDRRQLVEHRFVLQMQSWVHCVTTARAHGRALGDRYLEVRYEDLCLRPGDVVPALLERLGLPLGERARAWIDGGFVACRLRRWSAMRFTPAEARDFAAAEVHGAPLRRELGHDAG
jgi:hypothetical protein